MTEDREAFELRAGQVQAGRWLWRAAAAAAVTLALGACASEQRASDEAFPSLAEVPSQPPATMPQEERQTIVEEMEEDRAQATYNEPKTSEPSAEPAPLETAAPRDPFASSVIISGDSVTTSDQVAGLPLQTAAGPGQLAAIVFFGHGSDALDARDRSVLRDVAILLEQRGGSLRVVGHASSRTHNTTPDEHQLANFEMSLRRANVVLAELRSLGVPAEAVYAEAVGDAEPVYHEFMPSGEAGNRRVEIFLEN